VQLAECGQDDKRGPGAPHLGTDWCAPAGWPRSSRPFAQQARLEGLVEFGFECTSGGASGMIAILDYRAGNLRSVAKALEHVGARPVITDDPAVVARADGLVVPGQGSAVDAMKNLKQLGLVEPLREYVASGRPFLGVCLGEQVIFESSEEGPGVTCLGLIPGTVRRLPGGQKVPHIGWNSVKIKQHHPLLEGVPDDEFFYFVHSFYVDPTDPAMIVGETDYGVSFASIVAYKNVFATQFHPEKSSGICLKIYENFVKLVAESAPCETIETVAAVARV
jgi:glutamine amidotransferase